MISVSHISEPYQQPGGNGEAHLLQADVLEAICGREVSGALHGGRRAGAHRI